MPYMTAEVSNALVVLKRAGPRIYPALVKHLYDDRYSYSGILQAWINLSVGYAIGDVLSDGHSTYCGYRKTPSGFSDNVSFREYLRKKGPEKWADWAKNKSKLEIQNDFIDWCISKEKELGFVDDAQQKEILGIYQKAKERVQKEYSKKP